MDHHDKKTKNYRIECIEDETNGKNAEAAQPERLETDPLDDLPDVSEQTGGLPFVTFVLICLSACAIFLVNRMVTAGSGLVAVGCVLMILILVFGIVALVRGMFRKLHDEQAATVWYGISAAVMTIAILGGVIGGILFWF